MSAPILPPIPNADIVRRVHLAESRYTASRLGVLARLPNNPVGIEIRDLEDGGLAMQARFIPNMHFNRVAGLTDASKVGVLTAWYRDRGITGHFDVVPGFTPEAVIAELWAYNFSHVSFHATLFARPASAQPSAPGVTVELVDATTLEEFLDCHCRGWEIPNLEGFKANTRGWLTEPGWRLYLARYYDRPAGTAILFQDGNTAYCADSACDPELRGHGVHAALLARRLEDAGALGCDLVCAMAAYLSTSHRNMIRAGFSLLHTKSVWAERAEVRR